MPSSNRFKKVTDPDPKRITVTLWSEGGLPKGDVIGPISVGGEIHFNIAPQDGSLSAVVALNRAVQVANRLKAEIVVVDNS
jgi:hypothetical protein